MRQVTNVETKYIGGKHHYEGKDTLKKNETVKVNARDKNGKIINKAFVVKEIIQRDDGGYTVRLLSKS